VAPLSISSAACALQRHRQTLAWNGLTKNGEPARTNYNTTDPGTRTKQVCTRAYKSTHLRSGVDRSLPSNQGRV
jgi:hypothetical protein